MSIVIREAVEDDLILLEELERDSFNDPWSMEILRHSLASRLNTYLILEVDGRAVGYASYMLVVDEADVLRVAIYKADRGQGYGNILARRMVESAWSRGAEAITLEVRAGNIPAQRAYLASGFKGAGIRPNYYSDNHEDALIMWCYKEG